MKKFIFPTLSLLAITSYSSAQTQSPFSKITISVEKLDDTLDKIITIDPAVDIIAEGYKWSEGPLWVEQERMLLFSDVPTNTVFKWTEEDGVTVYLRPSGYTGTKPSESREPGSNGLLLDNEGNLVLCQHGDRRMARMEAPLAFPEPSYTTLIAHYQMSLLNSPNDGIYANDGTLFFTDPPYGLRTQDDKDPAKEIAHNGVYRLGAGGDLTLLTGALSRPNGIALFPAERKLLVSNSDSRSAAWYIVDADDPNTAPQLFYDATAEQTGVKGLPDGLKIMKSGVVLATGPGGVWIFSREAQLLGKIKLKDAVSNLALSTDEKYLFLTNSSRILRIQLSSD